MTDAVFVDTNVLVYAHDTTEPEKQAIAETWVTQLWQEHTGRTSLQVLNELYVTLTRKISRKIPADDAWRSVQQLFAWNPQATNPQMMSCAREIETRYRLSWWDSLIVAAAQLQDCTTLLTEDLKHGMDFDGVRVRNPFRPGVAEGVAGYSSELRPAYRINPRHRGRGRPKRDVVREGRD